MPELKRNFMKGRMNKDLDERLIPDGEYRDALNIEVSTAESSDVGTARNIPGNYNLGTIRLGEPYWEGGGSPQTVPEEGEEAVSNWMNGTTLYPNSVYSETCEVVGAVEDTQDDKIYVFAKDVLTLNAQPAGSYSAAGAATNVATASVNGAITDTTALAIDGLVQVSGPIAVGHVVTGTDVVYGTTVTAVDGASITLSTKNTLANDTALSFSLAAEVGVITDAILQLTPKQYGASPQSNKTVGVFIDTHTVQRIPWKPIAQWDDTQTSGANVAGFDGNPFTSTIYVKEIQTVSAANQLMNFGNGIQKGSKLKVMLNGVDLLVGTNNPLTGEPLGDVHVTDVIHTQYTSGGLYGGAIYAQIFVNLNKALPDVVTSDNIAAGLVYRFENEKLLDFQSGTNYDYTETTTSGDEVISDSTPIDTKITGIDIIDGSIYWTDGITEPKRVDIQEGILGSNTEDNNGNLLINLFRTTRMGYTNPISHKYGFPNADNDPAIIYGDNPMEEKAYELEDITVIRRYPLNPPDIEMKRSRRPGITHEVGLQSSANHIDATTALGTETTFSVCRNHKGDWNIPSYWIAGGNGDNQPNGETRTSHNDAVSLGVGDHEDDIRNHSWRVGDTLKLQTQWKSNMANAATTDSGTRWCTIKITEITSSKPGDFTGTKGPRVKNNKREEDLVYYDRSTSIPQLSYSTAIGATARYMDILAIKGTLVSMSDSLANINSSSGHTAGRIVDQGGSEKDFWSAGLVDSEKALYEDKFARFAYRYKYKNGQRSAMSPFSNPAFLPKTRFHWESKEGHNTAMVNDARLIKLKNFIDPSIPKDVESVDMLVKFDGENSIYFLKNIKKGSKEWNDDDNNWTETVAGKTGTYAVAGSISPPYPNKSASNKRGVVWMTSELNGNVIPSNQILRPFDNVPRKAKAQCVAASRLIYGNYTQDYPMIDADGKKVEPRLITGWKDPRSDGYHNLGVRRYSGLTGSTNSRIRDNRDPMPSIKADRTYTVGVAFLDRFGRQSPVILSPESSFKASPVWQRYKTKLKAKLDTSVGNYPYWATDYKFYVKETSNEYYNLAQFEAYPALGTGASQQDQVKEWWVSFNSADRNKIQEGDIIRPVCLRGGWSGSKDNTYKVLDIKNEAPYDDFGGGQSELPEGVVIPPTSKQGKFFVRIKSDRYLADEVFGKDEFGGPSPGVVWYSYHPPIWEVLPDPDVGLNIFYEVPRTYPIKLSEKNIDSFIHPGDWVYAYRVGYDNDTSDDQPTFECEDPDGTVVNSNKGTGSKPSDCYVLYEDRFNNILDDLRVKVKAVRGSAIPGGIQRIQLDQVVNFGLPVEPNDSGTGGWLAGSTWVGAGGTWDLPVTTGMAQGYPSFHSQDDYAGLNQATAYQVSSKTKFGSFHIMRPDGSKVHATIDNTNDAVLHDAKAPKLGLGYVDSTNYIGKNQPYYQTDTIEIKSDVFSSDNMLPWFNCWAFGNGVQSDRIRDDFNAPKLDNGVKASSTAPRYGEKNLKHGLIFSGIYNSKNNVNNLNQFISAEGITKDLNPEYGSIQKLFTRNTDILAFCENKVLKILSNKDALFNADGNTNLTSTKSVLGTAVPFRGDHGISRNPESFAADEYRCYFTDRDRGAVCRLSMDGITAISGIGMSDYFADELKSAVACVGAFNDKKGEYDLTIHNNLGTDDTDENTSVDITKRVQTLSFNEKTNSWVSFKSYNLEYGLSLNNEYYTFKQGEVWHHDDVGLTGYAVNRNNFYGKQFFSTITPVFNDAPGSTKSFQTVNYEGSQAEVLTNHRTGVTSGAHNNTTTLTLATSVTGLTVGQVVTGNDFTAPSDVNSPSGDDIMVTAINAAGTQLTLSQAVSIATGKSVVFSDAEYYNDDAYTGWYVESITTDKQTGQVLEFKEKEGKWFNNIVGDCTTFTNTTGGDGGSGNIDSQEFSLQGIAVSSNVSGGSGSGLYISTNVTGALAGDCTGNVTITSSSELLIPSASNLGTYDFTATGDETQTFTVCPNDGYILDTIAVSSVTIGGATVTVGSGSEIQSVVVTNPDYSAANLVSADMSAQSSITDGITCATVVVTWKAGYQPTANQVVVVNLTGNVYQASFNYNMNLLFNQTSGNGWSSSNPISISDNWAISTGEVGGTLPSNAPNGLETDGPWNYELFNLYGTNLQTNNSYEIFTFQYNVSPSYNFPNPASTNASVLTALSTFVNPSVIVGDDVGVVVEEWGGQAFLGTEQVWNSATAELISPTVYMVEFTGGANSEFITSVYGDYCIEQSFFAYWYVSSYTASGYPDQITVGFGVNFETNSLSCLPACTESAVGFGLDIPPLITFNPNDEIDGGDIPIEPDDPEVDDPTEEEVEHENSRKVRLTIQIQHDDVYGGSVTSTDISTVDSSGDVLAGESIGGLGNAYHLQMYADTGATFNEANITHVNTTADVAPSGGVATYVDGVASAVLPTNIYRVDCEDVTIGGANVVNVTVYLDAGYSISADTTLTLPIAGAITDIKDTVPYALRTTTLLPRYLNNPAAPAVVADPAGDGGSEWADQTAGSGFSGTLANESISVPQEQQRVVASWTGTTDNGTEHTIGTLTYKTIQGYRWATYNNLDLENQTAFIFDSALLSMYGTSFTAANWLDNHMQVGTSNNFIISPIGSDNPELYELSWATATTGSNATVQETITLTIKFTGNGVVHADEMLINLRMHNRFLAMPYNTEF
jgi:hypothetical protein